ncbi:hypothetical protein FDX19_02560 [Citrobacter sp. wls619]|uniref:hypothetical protein n=1 Tax=Citrobacter sp. wls619 TaxID=2576432 RepID=UPI0010C9BDA1|nr:hypothetical protein [Citrobacter sp. wls619]TKV13237.1 hypothetical protein FDX19_02560 [Citrobacter sp. wls619]
MSRYSTLRHGAIIAALDRFNANAGDSNTVFDEDFIPHVMEMFGVPFREVTPISWSTGGRSVAGTTPLANILRQTGMRTFRRIYVIGVTPGCIPCTGHGCAILDFSEDGQVVHFAPDNSMEPAELQLGDAIDAVVDLFQIRFGGEVTA